MIVKYGFVGLANTLFSYLLFYVKSLIWQHDPTWIVGSTNLVMTLVCYFSHGKLVFRQPLSFVGYLKYLCSTAVSVLISLFMFALFHNLLSFGVMVSFVLASMVAIPTLYLLSKFYAFRAMAD